MELLKKTIYYCWLAILMVACINKKEIPEDIIPKEKMVDILTDIHVMESKIEATRYLARDSMQAAYFQEQKRILNKYQIDSSKYYQSYDFYFKHMYHMKDIYIEVAAKTKALKEKAEGNKKDSTAPKKPAAPKVEMVITPTKVELPKEKEEKPVLKKKSEEE